MSIDIFSIFGSIPGKEALIFHRDPGAISGSAFIKNNINLIGAKREKNILDEFMHGNIPDFMRNFVPVTVNQDENSITYLVTPDYLCLGPENDYVRMPMNPHTAQKIADQYDCTLPTRKMVNDIWKASDNKLEPKPWGPPFDLDMEKTHRIGTHNQTIQNQLNGKDYRLLTSGHKKDLVLSNELNLNKNRLAIYGWIQLSGYPIQPLNSTSHSDLYADYSHGVRLCSNDVMVNGNPMRIEEVFKSSKLSSLISDEGILSFLRY